MRSAQIAAIASLVAYSVALPQNPVFLPFGDEDPGVVISAAGVGADGGTTFVASATTTTDTDFPIPTVTFVEGPGSVIVVPTQTFVIPADGGDSETFVLYQSCTVGAGGVANCFVSEEVGFDGTKSASAITQTVTLSVATVTSAGSSANPTEKSTTSSKSGSSTPSNTGSSSSSAPSATGSGAASTLVRQNGIVALIAGLFMLL